MEIYKRGKMITEKLETFKEYLISIRNKLSEEFNQNCKLWNKKQLHEYSITCQGIDLAISGIIKFQQAS